MADFRQIHTSIWDDDWFCQLPNDAKVIFIWFFSNRRASVSGLYKFTEFICSRETGIQIETVKTVIKQLVDDKKIYVEGEWVWVKNLRKYNYYKSDNSDKRIQKDLDQLPDNGLRHAYIEYYQPLDSPLIAPPIPLLEQEQEQEQGTLEQGTLENEKEKNIEHSKIPRLHSAFVTGFKRDYYPNELNSWLKEFSEMACEGVEGIDIKQAFEDLAGKYTITSPRSIKRAAISCMKKRISGGDKKPNALDEIVFENIGSN